MSLNLVNRLYLLSQLGFFISTKIFLSKIFFASEVTIQRKGKSFCIRNNRSDLSIFRQIYLDEVYSLIKPKNESTSGSVVDLGANVGFFTKYYFDKYPHLNYFLLEPDIENANQIKKNLKECCNWKFVFGGIGRSKEFLVNEDLNLNSCSKKYLSVNDNSSGTPAFSLKDFLCINDIKEIFILKIDIEGAEQFLLDDLSEFIPMIRYLMIELHDNLAPGVASRFFKIVSLYSFKFESRGDVLLFEFNHEDLNCD